MPAQRETFVVTAPWTTQSMMDGFQQAFTFAGFANFVDTFVSGSFRSAILPVVYDSSKALGTAFHWFMFGGQEIFYSTVTGWNAATDLPVGTQYRDWLSNLTNTSAFHYRLALLNANADTSITVFKSGVNVNFSWFLIRCGTISFNFHIPRTPPNTTFIDQNVHYYHPILFARALREGKGGAIRIARLPNRLRSSRFAGESLRGVSTASEYGAGNATLPWAMEVQNVMAVFNFQGNTNNTSAGYDQNSGSFSLPGMMVPVDFANVNTYLSADNTPIFLGARLLNFAEHFLPSDFGFAAYYGPPNVGQFDQYRNGTQRWDVIEVPASATNPVDDDQATPLFLCRTAD